MECESYTVANITAIRKLFGARSTICVGQSQLVDHGENSTISDLYLRPLLGEVTLSTSFNFHHEVNS